MEKYYESINKKYEKQVLKEEKKKSQVFEKEVASHDKEYNKYILVNEKIDNANTISEVPKINIKEIKKCLINIIGINISDENLNELVSILIDSNGNANEIFIKKVKSLLRLYAVTTDVNTIIYNLTTSDKLYYLVDEYISSIEKRELIINNEEYNEYAGKIKEINNAFEENALPKVGYGVINRRIRKDTKNLLSNKCINDLREILLNKNNTKEEVINFLSKYIKSKSVIKEIILNIYSDYKLIYLIDEYSLLLSRREDINFIEHERIKEKIRRSYRLRDLPKVSESTLNGYLLSNATIYKSDNRMKTANFKDLTNLLLNKYTFSDEIVKNEIKKIVNSCYPEKENAYELLLNKLSKLNKVNYLVEEINFAKLREEELLSLDPENIYTYHVEDKENSKVGGIFVRTYISAKDNLELEEIVSCVKDLNALETYVREHIDPTFAAVGGMILCKDEFESLRKSSDKTSVYSFKKNTGLEEIDIDTKEKLNRIESLDSEIQTKEIELENILNNINELKLIINKLYNHVSDDIKDVSRIRK